MTPRLPASEPAAGRRTGSFSENVCFLLDEDVFRMLYYTYQKTSGVQTETRKRKEKVPWSI